MSDLNLKMYKSREDYVNETNPVYSGKVTASGEMEITQGIKKNTIYYIDIFSGDSYLSNWEDCIDIVDDIFTNCDAKNRSNEISNIPLEINLYRGRRQFINTWEFINYSHIDGDLGQATDRRLVKIKKDLTVESTEFVNNVEYKVVFKITRLRESQCTLVHVSTNPSTGYTNINATSNEAYLNLNNKQLSFNFAYETAEYEIE